LLPAVLPAGEHRRSHRRAARHRPRWLFLAWANGKGSALARVGAIIACAVYGALTIQGYAQGDASYAPVAAIVASSTVLVIGVAAVILLLMRQSWPYYTRPATAR
jgi:hypothetical protein